MNNDLEKFIEDNRGDLDDRTPSGKVWENVEASLNGKKEKKFIVTLFFKWSIAASVLLMAGTGVYFLLNKNKTAEKENTVSVIRTEIPDAPPEMNQFAVLIGMKREELKTLGLEQPELYRKFATDITQLDSSYKSLKDQLSVTPNREMLIEAMIQNLQLQLNVLNQQLNIIHQIKQSKKDRHEKNDQAI
jgi:hypothetical protein